METSIATPRTWSCPSGFVWIQTRQKILAFGRLYLRRPWSPLHRVRQIRCLPLCWCVTVRVMSFSKPCTQVTPYDQVRRLRRVGPITYRQDATSAELCKVAAQRYCFILCLTTYCFMLKTVATCGAGCNSKRFMQIYFKKIMRGTSFAV